MAIERPGHPCPRCGTNRWCVSYSRKTRRRKDGSIYVYPNKARAWSCLACSAAYLRNYMTPEKYYRKNTQYAAGVKERRRKSRKYDVQWKAHHRNAANRQTDKLNDGYIRRCIRSMVDIPVEKITPQMVEAQRLSIQLKRQFYGKKSPSRSGSRGHL